MTDSTPSKPVEVALHDDLEYSDFQTYFPHTPTALCIRECIRLGKLRGYPCESPVLDVGCGDGLFARIAFRSAEVWGIDIDAQEGRWAQASQAYSQIIIGDVVHAKLPEGFFKTCVANCSLEHIPDIAGALRTIYRSLAPGGTAYLFVPTVDWAESLESVRLSRRFGLGWLGDAIRSGIDGVFRHHHLYDAPGWQRLCESVGFEVTELSPVGSSAATQAFEAFLPSSVLGFLNKKVTGRWTNLTAIRGIAAFPTYLTVQLAMRLAAKDGPVAEYFLAVRRPLEPR